MTMRARLLLVARTRRSHRDVVAPNIAAIVDVFVAHRKRAKTTSQP
jgi:hypothetical protein